jgi:hypothetical protein
MIDGFHQMVRERGVRLKTQEEEIEKLQKMVYELKGNMKRGENKLKGHEHRIGKRYQTRSGKN